MCGFAPLAHLLTTSSHSPLVPSPPSFPSPFPVPFPPPLPSPSLLVLFIVFEVNKWTSGIPGANEAETCRGGACGSVRTWISLRSGPFTVSYCRQGGVQRDVNYGLNSGPCPPGASGDLSQEWRFRHVEILNSFALPYLPLTSRSSR